MVTIAEKYSLLFVKIGLWAAMVTPSSWICISSFPSPSLNEFSSKDNSGNGVTTMIGGATKYIKNEIQVEIV